MRILSVVFNVAGTGTYWRAYQFGASLARRGHAVTLLATAPRARLRLAQTHQAGMRLVEAPDLLPGMLRTGWDGWNVLRRLLWLRGQRFDIIHAYECRPAAIYPAISASRDSQAPLVIDWADWFGSGGSVEERQNPLLRSLLRPVETYFEERFRPSAQGNTVINRVLYQKALALGVNPARLLLLRNGSDPATPLLDRAAARRQLGLPQEALLIGFVGRTYPQDAALMAAAFNRVRQRLPQARLLLVGYFNRPIERWLDDPAAALRSGPISLEEMYPYLSACDLCWLPVSDSGANRGRWPLKLNDYLAVGRPVIATTVGDLPEVVASGGFGRAVPPEPDALAQAALALLADRAELERLGRAARLAAETIYRWDHLADDLEAFYRRLLEPQGRPLTRAEEGAA
jgi:glycosyltransferase involved in cell wall biosynthesis